MMVEIREATRNGKTLASFVSYCIQNPSLRFWQALRNWSGYNFVITTDVPPYEITEGSSIRDTFYLEGRRHDEQLDIDIEKMRTGEPL